MSFVPTLTSPMDAAGLLIGENKATDPSNRVIEVTVGWRDSIEKIDHFDVNPERPAAFHIGEDPACDFIFPVELLDGQPRFALVSSNGIGQVFVHIPPGARAAAVFGNGKESELTQSPALLHPTEKVEVRIGHCTFSTRLIAKENRPEARVRFDRSLALFTVLSLLCHALFLTVLFFTPPWPWEISFDAFQPVDRYLAVTVEAPAAKQKPSRCTKGPICPDHR